MRYLLLSLFLLSLYAPSCSASAGLTIGTDIDANSPDYGKTHFRIAVNEFLVELMCRTISTFSEEDLYDSAESNGSLESDESSGDESQSKGPFEQGAESLVIETLESRGALHVVDVFNGVAEGLPLHATLAKDIGREDSNAKWQTLAKVQDIYNELEAENMRLARIREKFSRKNEDANLKITALEAQLPADVLILSREYTQGVITRGDLHAAINQTCNLSNLDRYLKIIDRVQDLYNKTQADAAKAAKVTRKITARIKELTRALEQETITCNANLHVSASIASVAVIENSEAIVQEILERNLSDFTIQSVDIFGKFIALEFGHEELGQSFHVSLFRWKGFGPDAKSLRRQEVSQLLRITRDVMDSLISEGYQATVTLESLVVNLLTDRAGSERLAVFPITPTAENAAMFYHDMH